MDPSSVNCQYPRTFFKKTISHQIKDSEEHFSGVDKFQRDIVNSIKLLYKV